VTSLQTKHNERGRAWPLLPLTGMLRLEYNNDFQYDLKVGQLQEKWLGDLLEGQTIEVKRDFMASQTGNVFVEFFCRGKPSGIATTKAQHWAFILSEETVVLLPTAKLKTLARQAHKNGRIICGGDSNASQGVLINVERLVQDAISS